MLHDFSVWLGTGSNPVDINRFRSFTGKKILNIYLINCAPGDRRKQTALETCNKISIIFFVYIRFLVYFKEIWRHIIRDMQKRVVSTPLPLTRITTPLNILGRCRGLKSHHLKFKGSIKKLLSVLHNHQYWLMEDVFRVSLARPCARHYNECFSASFLIKYMY